jgi:ABC-2 type transport system ATP-binding protein
MPLTETALTLDRIRKSYRTGLRRRRVPAVEDLSLEVSPGEIFGLLGPNGAGKTTTIKALLGMVFPDSGYGSLLGRPLGDRRSHARLGFLPEQPYFYGFLNAERGLHMYGRLFDIGSGILAGRIGELLDLVGLPRGSHLTLDKYSKGMLQRFGIAQALINDPDLVIMDEPSSGLDPVGQKEIRDLILGLKERGKTVFLSSHQLSEVESICDSVSIVNLGRTVKAGKLKELLSVPGSTTIVLSGGGPTDSDRLSRAFGEAREVAGETVLEVEAGKVFRVIEEARSLGMELVSATPARRSLEELFLQTIRETSK